MRNERGRDEGNRDWRNSRDENRDNWRKHPRNFNRQPVVVHNHWVNSYIPLTYGGRRFYYNDGAYYLFNGFGYTLTNGNIGAFIYSLPFGYRTLYINNYLYYRFNNVYYIRDRFRRVYLRVDDPYDNVSLWKDADDASDYDGDASEYKELFVYPNGGQSEGQMRQDKYECHLWAVKRTGFDPGLGKPGDFSGYRRAQSACLEGRGYTVR